IQKSGSAQTRSSKSGANCIQRLCLRMRSSRAPLQPREDPEVAAQEHQTDCYEDDERFKRDEFEENLRKTGLELEKDEKSTIPGIGFLKIHAPWNVLCREAEFMKLKMPTKKVYEVKQGSNVVEKIRMFIHKVTAPLHPKVGASRSQCEKSLCHPFSREKQHLVWLSGDLFRVYPASRPMTAGIGSSPPPRP
uniref:Anoctamin dimerisation domain-containing protein n=1 Tax=Amphilophus citrinellus TaxID=61819 RepID=A0A3Q0QTI6_AMPCI